MQSLSSLTISLFYMLLAIAALSDLRDRKIPNKLNLLILAVGLSLRAQAAGWSGVWLGLQGAGLALLLLFPFFVLRWYGGGDVKLMIGGGAYLGTSGCAEAIVLGAILGGLLAAAQLVLMKSARRRESLARLRTALLFSSTQAPDQREAHDHVPMALAFSSSIFITAYWQLSLF